MAETFNEGTIVFLLSILLIFLSIGIIVNLIFSTIFGSFFKRSTSKGFKALPMGQSQYRRGLAGSVRQAKRRAELEAYSLQHRDPLSFSEDLQNSGARGQSESSTEGYGDTDLAESAVLETVSVVLRKRVPIRNGESQRSWFGGSPMMPENVPWPTYRSRDNPHHGDTPLHFIAQLCCSDFPEDLWGGLGPRNGWLLFFLDPNSGDLDGQAKGCRVIHTNSLGSERAAPRALGPVHDGVHAGPLYGYLEGSGDVPNVWRRWPLDFVTVPNRVFEDETGFERVTPESFAKSLYEGQDVSDIERLPSPEPFTERMARAVLISIRTRLEKYTQAPQWDDSVIEGLKDPDKFRSLRKDLPALEKKLEDLRATLKDGHELDQDKAAETQDSIQKLEASLGRQRRLERVLNRYPSAESLQDYRNDIIRTGVAWQKEALQELSKLLDDVSSSDRDRVLGKGEWMDIQDSLERSQTRYFTFFRTSRGEYLAMEKVVALWDFCRKNNTQLWEFVADYYVDPERNDLIPASVLQMFEPCWRQLVDNRPHRVGGEFDALQSNPRSGPVRSLLLLHLACDYGMNWMWGDAGIVYFMISTQDLEDGRFENATATLECH